MGGAASKVGPFGRVALEQGAVDPVGIVGGPRTAVLIAPLAAVVPRAGRGEPEASDLHMAVHGTR